MSIISELHQDDWGTNFQVTVKEKGVVVDLSSATGMIIVFRQPDGAIIERPLTWVSDGVDGKVYYLFPENEVIQAGVWSYQLMITFPSGSWHTQVGTFKVHKNL